jgi:hypothetical protein
VRWNSSALAWDFRLRAPGYRWLGIVMSPVGASASDPGYSMRVLLPSNAGIALEKHYFFGLTAQIKVIPTAWLIKTK